MKKNWLWLIVLALALVLSACGAGETNTDNNGNSNGVEQEAGQQTDNGNAEGESEPEGESASLKTEYPLTITDASGMEFTFEQAPERIVSIAPSLTEVLFALDLGDRVVGVSEFDNYPEEAAEKPKVGNLQGNPEALLAAEPDIVVAGLSLNGSSLESLRDLGIPVFTTEPTTIDEVIDSILVIGQITDTQEKAQEVANKMRADKQLVIDAVSGLTDEQKKNVYIEYSPLWTAGKGSFMDELIVLSGGINIASELDQWAQISSEAVIEANPDVIIYADTTDYETGKPLVETIVSRPGWDQLNAMVNDAIVGINEDILSRSGPRITDALLEVAAGIYPELFE